MTMMMMMIPLTMQTTCEIDNTENDDDDDDTSAHAGDLRAERGQPTPATRLRPADPPPAGGPVSGRHGNPAARQR